MTPLTVTVFDYGAGNLHSLVKALELSGARVRVDDDPLTSTRYDALVLPGVGAFGPAAARIAPARDAMRQAIDDGLPSLGICLGMQLLFDSSEEAGGCGLGVIRGNVRRLRGQRVPQMGWNTLESVTEPLIATSAFDTAYFANSYVCEPVEASVVRATSTHEGERFPAAVRQGRAIGVQFHPEKSSAPGLRFLRAFIDEARTR